MTTRRMPFNIIDEVFVHADDPAHPLTVQIEARAAGALDADRLRDAVGAALNRHPMARARLAPWAKDARSFEWLIDAKPQVDPVRIANVGDESDLDDLRSEFYSTPVSLFESPPLRVRHVQDSGGDRVMVSIQHSASDGMGALRLLQSICREYAGADDPVPDFDAAEARQFAAQEARPSLTDWLHTGRMELQRWTNLGSLPARLTMQGETTRSGYGLKTLSLPLGPIVSAPLRKATGASVNDVLVAAASRAAGRWIEEHDKDAGRVSVFMPINARPAEWSREIVANLVTGDIVSTKAAERASVEECLAAVAGWTDAVKKRGPGTTLAALNKIRPFDIAGMRAATRFVMRSGASLADTLILSNLGRVPDDFVEGDGLQLTEVYFSPPVAMPCGLGLGAAAFDGKLFLTLRHCWALWSSDAVDRFSAILCNELDQLAAA